jgi:hypothetical protein
MPCSKDANNKDASSKDASSKDASNKDTSIWYARNWGRRHIKQRLCTEIMRVQRLYLGCISFYACFSWGEGEGSSDHLILVVEKLRSNVL